MQLPAQIDVLTRMACRVHRPDIAIELGLPLNIAPTQSITPSTYQPIALSDILPGFTRLSFDVDAVKSSNDSDSAPDERTPAQLCAKDPTVKKAVASMLTGARSPDGPSRSATEIKPSPDIYGRHLNDDNDRLVGPGEGSHLQPRA